MSTSPAIPFRLRTGIGYDVHRLVSGKKLVIGGVTIPHNKGSLAHSDGDVLIHAICDALLGAVAMGDIGVHFPNSDNSYKDIDSIILLEKVREIIAQKGFAIASIDSVVCLQKPKLRDFIGEMRINIARALETDAGNISVKATTSEGLGFEGREEGISAFSSVLLIGSNI